MQRMCSSKNWALLFHLSHTDSFSSSYALQFPTPTLSFQHLIRIHFPWMFQVLTLSRERKQAINIKKNQPMAAKFKSAIIYFMSETKEIMHWSVPISTSIFSGKQDPPEQLDVHKQCWPELREELALGGNSWGTAPWFPKLAHSSEDRQNQAAFVSSIWQMCGVFTSVCTYFSLLQKGNICMKCKSMFPSECYGEECLLLKTEIQNKHFWILMENNALSSLYLWIKIDTTEDLFYSCLASLPPNVYTFCLTSYVIKTFSSFFNLKSEPEL